MHRNNILNKQIQFKSHIPLEHITKHTHNNDLSNNSAISKDRMDSIPRGTSGEARNEQKLVQAVRLKFVPKISVLHIHIHIINHYL